MGSPQSPPFSIPEKMKRMVVVEAGPTVKECKIEVQEVDVPKPGSNEVLIKMVAAAVNPSDYGDWTTAKKPNIAMGKEGSGIIVASGGGLLNALVRIGQNVGVVGLKKDQGTYSEYVTVSSFDGYFPLPDDLPVEDAASFFVNPYTALGILDTAKQHSKAFIHTAAASQLGQMMVKLISKGDEGVEVINVVRRTEQAKLLEDLGAKHIINTSDKDWKEQLKAKVEELECTVGFDAVAGSSTGEILDCLPSGATLYVYGGLAGSCRDISPIDLVYRRKQIKGFLLTTWIQSGGMAYMYFRMRSARAKVNTGLHAGEWASSQFKDIDLENVQKECVALLESNATGTKLRIRFDKENT